MSVRRPHPAGSGSLVFAQGRCHVDDHVPPLLSETVGHDCRPGPAHGGARGCPQRYVCWSGPWSLHRRSAGQGPWALTPRPQEGATAIKWRLSWTAAQEPRPRAGAPSGKDRRRSVVPDRPRLGHRAASVGVWASSSASRSRMRPSRIRDLAVPIGRSSMAATSVWV